MSKRDDQRSLSTGTAAERIDQLCEEFGGAWRAGLRPRIEDYIGAGVTDRSQLLYRLVMLELELLIRSGEKPKEAHYRERFPNDGDTLREVFAEWGETEPFVGARPVVEASDRPQRSGGAAEAYLAAGDRIGKYVVQRPLGRGSFGIVYLARHPQLDTEVAIKVPRAGRFESDDQLDAFLNDARHAASVRHPGIVIVHDVDLDGKRPFIVQEYLAGGDLKQALATRATAPEDAARMVAEVADAVSFAHRQGVYHRDLKPGNILLDGEGRPRVTDFGLAVREPSRRLHKGEVCGTPAYMSPEQVRGETHRLDGRCDVWSLGVILYQLLAGRLPFAQQQRRALFDDILLTEPPPLRQLDPQLPAELERICARCLAKQMTDRYATASDLADDLRHWLRETVGGSAARATPGPERRDRIVPKLLRAFDREDRDFFLELLPGPKDREGLPDAIRFWKTRIEQQDADQAFAVGLLYGPSGCGKSSLVKAGLLPRLNSTILPVYIESTANETELRLATELRKRFPALPEDLTLAQMLESLREGDGWPRAGKLLIVLDQFEQWLHAHHELRESELIDALRQCDGARVQALVMVRDDFWMAATRFLRALEVELVQGRNLAAVDRFDVRHARKVLTLFGQAYGALPERTHEMTAEQNAFVDQAIDALAQDGRVVSVRLAVFAHMVRSKPWTPATLRKAGGAEGIGVAFLEETFRAPEANPKHRLHAAAAQRVLQELLPAGGVAMKGTMQSHTRLREASRCDPAEFEQVVGILDRELSLIMPTDPSGHVANQGGRPHHAERYYQLTHDYLVPALREWLTRNQRASRRGRAQLLLDELTAAWNQRPETRQLPTFGEWLTIAGWTDPTTRTVPQQQMLRAAKRRWAKRAGVLLALVVIAVLGAREGIGRVRATGLVNQLQSAGLSEVGLVLADMESYSRWAQSGLRRAWVVGAVPPTNEMLDSQYRRRLNLALALVRDDPGQVPFVEDSLLRVRPEDVQEVARFLLPWREQATQDLWGQLKRVLSRSSEEPLRVASALALLDAQSAEWQSCAETMATHLISARPLQISAWTAQLFPIRRHVLPHLLAAFDASSLDEAQRRNLAEVMAVFAADDPEQLAAATQAAHPDQLEPLLAALRENGAAAVGALRRAASADRTPVSVEAWDPPSAETIAQIEQEYAGVVTPRAAIAVTVPGAAVEPLLGAMAAAGYRPSSLRPYALLGEPQFALTWTRDGRAWQYELGVSAAELMEEDGTRRREGWELVDLSLHSDGSTQPPVQRFCALWVEQQSPSTALLVLDQPLSAYRDQLMRLESDQYYIERYFVRPDSAGLPLFSALWRRHEQSFRDNIYPNFKYLRQFGDPYPGFLQVDCQLLPVDLTRNDLLLVADPAADLEARLERSPGNPDMHESLAQYKVLLGQYDGALALLDELQRERPTHNFFVDLRARALARMGNLDALRAEIARYTSLPQQQPDLLSVMRLRAALLAGELSESAGLLKALVDQLGTASSRPVGLVQSVLRAHALAIPSFREANDTAMAVHCEQVAFSLLPQADYTTTLLFDADFSALRHDPRFQQLVWDQRLAFYAGAAWRDTDDRESKLLLALPVGEHQEQFRELLEQGYQPACVAARDAQVARAGIVSSVWHRSFPTVDEQVTRAARQGNLAIALAHLGEVDELLSVLEDRQGRQARAELLDRLPRTGFDPRDLLPLLAAHPSNSARRSLLILLGSLDASTLQLAEGDSLVARIQQLADTTDDASIRSAALWCLRRWGIPPVPPGPAPANGNWQYVHPIGQMMISVQPPRQVLLGSPCWEPDRGGSEVQQWVRVDHSFALSATEITVAQFDLFLKDERVRQHYQTRPFEYSAEYAPSADCPQTSVRYFDAILFCQWLSEEEGIELGETCYLDIWQHADGAYEMPNNYLDRKGYRLPTELEWEIACRAGAATSRPYGHSERLLSAYSWGLSNAGGRTHPVALLIPNDFGFHDMLGNVSEWCQSAYGGNYTSRVDADTERRLLLETNRVNRGGSVVSLPRELRTADRAANIPTYKSFPRGFRIARTIPRSGP